MTLVQEGRAQALKINGKEVIAKTGSSSSNRDIWASGCCGDHMLTVWAGYRSNESLYDIQLNNAKTIWKSIMESLHPADR